MTEQAISRDPVCPKADITADRSIARQELAEKHHHHRAVVMERNSAPVSAGVACATKTVIAEVAGATVGPSVARAVEDRLARIREAWVKVMRAIPAANA